MNFKGIYPSILALVRMENLMGCQFVGAPLVGILFRGYENNQLTSFLHSGEINTLSENYRGNPKGLPL